MPHLRKEKLEASLLVKVPEGPVFFLDARLKIRIYMKPMLRLLTNSSIKVILELKRTN